MDSYYLWPYYFRAHLQYELNLNRRTCPNSPPLSGISKTLSLGLSLEIKNGLPRSAQLFLKRVHRPLRPCDLDQAGRGVVRGVLIWKTDPVDPFTCIKGKQGNPEENNKKIAGYLLDGKLDPLGERRPTGLAFVVPNDRTPHSLFKHLAPN